MAVDINEAPDGYYPVECGIGESWICEGCEFASQISKCVSTDTFGCTPDTRTDGCCVVFKAKEA